MTSWTRLRGVCSDIKSECSDLCQIWELNEITHAVTINAFDLALHHSKPCEFSEVSTVFFILSLACTRRKISGMHIRQLEGPEKCCSVEKFVKKQLWHFGKWIKFTDCVFYFTKSLEFHMFQMSDTLGRFPKTPQQNISSELHIPSSYICLRSFLQLISARVTTFSDFSWSYHRIIES